MMEKGDGSGGPGAFARMRHSIRAQYSLATAFFLLTVLGVFYVGGRIVLVHLVREAEQQVKDIGFDISRLAYRNAEQVKQQNIAAADAAMAKLAEGWDSRRLLESKGFQSLSLVIREVDFQCYSLLHCLLQIEFINLGFFNNVKSNKVIV